MMMSFNEIKNFNGVLQFLGDKSISHRALIFSAMADGVSTIKNLSNADDVNSTLLCLQQLGTDVAFDNDLVIVKGNGYKGFKQPQSNLNAGNSGTTARLLTGLLAAQDFPSKLVGDESLSKRPMDRVVNPLLQMNAQVFYTPQFTLPLNIYNAKLKPINYRLELPSAQVKSCLILAALHLEEQSIIIDPFYTRNHTELLLGLSVDGNNEIEVSKKDYPAAREYKVPGDISSAAFFIVLTLLAKDSTLLIKNALLNKNRTEFINVLLSMGADIKIENLKANNNEDYGDIVVKSSLLKNVHIKKSIIPKIIDEIPALAVAGAFADGTFEIKNAKELSVKESNRINSICYNMKSLGLKVEEDDDGFSISGEPTANNCVFESFNDHRIAMMSSILSLLLKDGGKVNNFDCVSISNPLFLSQVNSLSQ